MITSLPLTSVLPAIRKIPDCSAEDISGFLKYLLCLCNPPVRGSRGRRNTSVITKAHAEIPLDAFERAHAIRWLTAMISYGDLWESETLIEDAAAILALCAGTSAAGIIHRTFVFPLKDSKRRINVQIRDIPLENHDFSSVGAQTWGGACMLSEMIVEDPESYIPSVVGKTKMLELGAGTGLVSLALGNLCVENNINASIVSTDFYPSVLENLQLNIQANFPSTSSKLDITSSFLDWQNPPPDLELFDIVFGADIVYDHRHAAWIKNCLRTLLRKAPSALFHLVIPLRKTFAAESCTVDSVFADELVVQSKEVIECGADAEGDEVVEYAYYRIGWASA